MTSDEINWLALAALKRMEASPPSMYYAAIRGVCAGWEVCVGPKGKAGRLALFRRKGNRIVMQTRRCGEEYKKQEYHLS